MYANGKKALLTVGNWHNLFYEIKFSGIKSHKKKERENNQIYVRVMRLMTIQMPLFSLISLLLSNLCLYRAVFFFGFFCSFNKTKAKMGSSNLRHFHTLKVFRV